MILFPCSATLSVPPPLFSNSLCNAVHILQDDFSSDMYRGYSATPSIVARVEREDQVRDILLMANQYRMPLTFFALGSSLVGAAACVPGSVAVVSL